MSALDVLAACSRAADRGIGALVARAQRQEALERRAELGGPGARRRPDPPDRVGWTWRWRVWRNRIVRLWERLGG